MKLIDLLSEYYKGNAPKRFRLQLYSIEYIFEKNESNMYYEIDTEEELTDVINLMACLDCNVEVLDNE